jgi:hypothetical protein
MNLDSNQADDPANGVAGKRSERARRRSFSKNNERENAIWIFFGLAFVSVAISFPLWFYSNSSSASIMLCACIAVVSGWYVAYNAKIYGGLTFSSCFVGVSAFVFVARGLYISFYDDFDILIRLEQPAEHRVVTGALVYVLYGILAFIFGALLLESKVLKAFRKSHVQGRIALSLFAPNVSLAFIGVQVAFIFLLLPYGRAQERASLADSTSSAYIYLLPTLIHGFNLYFFAYMTSGWVRKKDGIHLLMLLGSALLMFVHSYCLYNMSNFRGFYTIGLFTASIVFILARLGKVPVLLLLLIFALYPLFKTMGSDRTQSNKDMVNNVLMAPRDSYNSEGFERAFGSATDINMLDTLVASLNWEHNSHPYVLSYLYVFVHWIPRSAWPGKPAYGILADMSYTRGAPFSAGVIGFLNDDGGRIYMIIAMGFLGALFKWCEIQVLRIRWRELYLCVWAALFLASLVTVRYLPYQVFYGFMVFFVPALLLNWGLRLVAEQSGGTYRKVKKGSQKMDEPVAS